MSLLIGTSGWSYPSGEGTWNGLFYPRRRRSRGQPAFDELRFYAEHFDTVEVNSTFYAQPRPDVTRTWVARTRPGFEFSIKLYQKFTHPRMFREAALARAPGSEGTLLDLLAAITPADLEEFRTGVEPLATAGRLGVLLAQFPPSFTRTDRAHDYLAWLLKTLSDYPVAVELRHRSWSDEANGTVSLLTSHGAAWVQIDEPKFRTSVRQNFLPNVAAFSYMRLHGRNAARWWHHDRTEDRYNYLYSAAELRDLADVLGATGTLARKAYLYTNNHFAAKSVVNAVMLKHQLGQPITGSYPPELVARYPEIAPLVTVTASPSPVRSRP
jgi:uncharacterized protein YecE (DUF72 family)